MRAEPQRLRFEIEALFRSDPRAAGTALGRGFRVLLDKDGRILVWNSAAERLFGRDWTHMRQADVAEIYEEPQAYRDFLQKVQVQYAQRENIFNIRHPQKGTRSISTSFTILYDGHHNFQGVLSLSRDVTAVKKLEKKYRQTFFWLIASVVVSGLMIAAIFMGYPYFSKGRASADLRQQELRIISPKIILCSNHC